MLDASKLIRGDNSKSKKPFNPGRLTLSIARAFSHSPDTAKEVAYWLAQTVENELSTQRESLSTDDITAATHKTLKNFDELAAIQYAAQHQLITSVRRRERPSVA